MSLAGRARFRGVAMSAHRPIRGDATTQAGQRVITGYTAVGAFRSRLDGLTAELQQRLYGQLDVVTLRARAPLALGVKEGDRVRVDSGDRLGSVFEVVVATDYADSPHLAHRELLLASTTETIT